MDEKHALVDAPPRVYGEPLWPDDEPSSRRPDTHWLAPVPKIMTVIAQGSAPFISTFLLIHLTAPVAATLGGSSLASQIMVSRLSGLTDPTPLKNKHSANKLT